MNTTKLVEAIEDRAEELRTKALDGEYTDEVVLRDSRLLMCLARMVERNDGTDIYGVFGAPGDWGYGTPIGDALCEAYTE